MADGAQSTLQKLHALLSGQVDMADADPSIQSWARYHIHEGALEVLRSGGIEERRATLLKIPARIRPYVEAEAKRVWPLIMQR